MFAVWSDMTGPFSVAETAPLMSAVTLTISCTPAAAELVSIVSSLML